jgi:hypothetical protein
MLRNYYQLTLQNYDKNCKTMLFMWLIKVKFSEFLFIITLKGDIIELFFIFFCNFAAESYFVRI